MHGTGFSLRHHLACRCLIPCEFLAAELHQRVADFLRGGVEFFSWYVFLLESKVKVSDLMDRDQVVVHVGHFQPGYHHADFDRIKGFLDRFAHDLRGVHHARGQIGRHIQPVVHFLPGHYQRVAGGDGGDRHEGDYVLIFVDKAAGHLAADDAGKQTRHSGSVSPDAVYAHVGGQAVYLGVEVIDMLTQQRAVADHARQFAVGVDHGHVKNRFVEHDGQRIVDGAI